MECFFAATGSDFSLVFVELGLVVLGLAIMARLASRWGFSAIPLYLIAGLAFGDGGLAPIRFGEEFVRLGAEVGVVLLLFMLGLEYAGDELVGKLKTGLAAGLVDFALNFTPGVLAGWTLGFHLLPSVLLGGVTYISSSGVIAKVISELKRKANPETPVVVSILVLEDLAMALYLPIMAVLVAGTSVVAGLISVGVAVATVMVVLFIATRFGKSISDFVSHQSDEVIVLSTIGMVLLVSGVAQKLQVSAAVGAFLVGVAFSGPLSSRARLLIRPLRDLFAAIFFLFFGLQTNPSTLVPVMWIAIGLGLVTAGTKIATGWWAAQQAGLSTSESLRAGTTLVARGEFSIVVAGFGLSLEPRLAPLSAAYVLFLAIVGPILARLNWVPKGSAQV